MGIVIEKYKAGNAYSRHSSQSDNFKTDATGRLLAHPGEVFEIMPLGSLTVIAFVNVGKTYQQNPYTTPGMRWEVGFSAERVSFYSPDTDLVLGGIAERPGAMTMGFYYYHELRSLSLGSMREASGPYVSMVFSIQATPFSPILVGVRVHGTQHHLGIFATMLAARLIESYSQMSSKLSLDTRELERFFEEISGFDYNLGNQTDLFISATENTLHVTRDRPQQFS